jgi:hypothetical protein
MHRFDVYFCTERINRNKNLSPATIADRRRRKRKSVTEEDVPLGIRI